MAGDSEHRQRLLFITSNQAWGGSEELWSATAASLAAAGHTIAVAKSGIDESQPRIQRLRELACRVHDLSRIPFVPPRAYARITALTTRIEAHQQAIRLSLLLRLYRRRGHLAVISQGGNFDGWMLGAMCRRRKVPYVLIVQKAAEMYWPSDPLLRRIQEVYLNAAHTYFVSDENRRLTEEQIGLRLERASVVRNPFLVPWETRSDWPEQSSGIRVACVGRFYMKEKGQDLLLRVLARDRWRGRPIAVTFFGEGLNAAGIATTAALLGLNNVRIAGFVKDVSAIWDDHHALVLPSRCEGLPLVVVEAMLSGRVVIATDVGGNREVIQDGLTGFLANAATADALDDAMERAWQSRPDWRQIGDRAAKDIRQLVPPDPAALFGAQLLKVASSLHVSGGRR